METIGNDKNTPSSPQPVRPRAANGTIVYDGTANSDAAHSAAITFSGGGLTRTLTVKQNGKDKSLKPKAAARTAWVTTSDLPPDMRVLFSTDAIDWSESGGTSVRYLWLLFPATPAPEIREILTLP